MANCYDDTAKDCVTPDVAAGWSRDNDLGVNASASPGNESLAHVDGVPQRYQSLLVALYAPTTALSVVGNVLAIVVFTAGRRSRTDLRWFLINLAAADLIMAVFCMPFTFTTTLLNGHWVFSAPMCPVVLFLQTVSVTASVFTSVAVGIDRYCIVNFPLRSRITKSRSPLVIAAIWTVTCVLSSVQLFVGRSNTQTLPGGQQVAKTLVALSCCWPDEQLQELGQRNPLQRQPISRNSYNCPYSHTTLFTFQGSTTIYSTHAHTHTHTHTHTHAHTHTQMKLN